MSEEVKNPELKVVNSKKTTKKVANAVNEECKCDINAVEQAPPSTVYQVLMSRMTPEQLASISVQLIQVNGSELFWMTSVGQLYAFNNKKAAFEAEYAWLMSSPNLDNK